MHHCRATRRPVRTTSYAKVGGIPGGTLGLRESRRVLVPPCDEQEEVPARPTGTSAGRRGTQNLPTLTREARGYEYI